MSFHEHNIADKFPRRQYQNAEINPHEQIRLLRQNRRMAYDPIKLGKNITKFRKLAGNMTGRKLGRLIGADEKTIRNVEAGGTLNVDRLYRIAEALNQPVWRLLDEEPPHMEEVKDLLNRIRLLAKSVNRSSSEISDLEREIVEIEALLLSEQDATEG